MLTKSKVIKKLLTISIATTLVISNLSSVFAYSTELVITPIKQAKTNWCWAASADMAANRIYSGTSGRNQSDIVYHVKGWILNKYPNEGGTLEESKNGSEYVCHDDSSYIFKYSNDTFSIEHIQCKTANTSFCRLL